jgi:UDPglucose 6-dehydrogenase
MTQPLNITIVGSGYVGLVAAACFSELGHQVVCVDKDIKKIDQLRAGEIPIHEEYLPELLHRHRGKRLTFTSDLGEATREADVIFVAVGTPQSSSGSADLSYIDAVACEVARSVAGYKVIVEKSTVPVFTNEWIGRVLMRNGVPRSGFDVASNPEFLREGTAVQDFLIPDRIVIGADSDRAVELLRRLYLPLTSGEYYLRADCLFPSQNVTSKLPTLLLTSTKAAELIKHASNAFLAMKISFINNVANICEAAGADVDEVATGIGMDERIGSRFLNPGIGYGGSCFPKDVAAFRYVANQLGVNFDLLREVETINEKQQEGFVKKVASALWTLRGKKIGVLGLAFKGGTDDIRDSPAIAIVQSLLQKGCVITAYDPAAMERTAQMLPASDEMRYAADPYSVAEGADALLVLTDWKSFTTLDLGRLRSLLRYPIVIDGRNLFDPHTMAAACFDYLSVGRPPVHAAGAETSAHKTMPAAETAVRTVPAIAPAYALGA